MSDVSKTNELIEEARRQVGNIEDKSKRERLIADLADALETKTGVRVDMSSAVGVETQLAAARVPVRGEPNDGATQDRIAEIACTALGHRQGGDECMADYAIADAILAEFPVLSRATVPDAATEEAFKKAVALSERRQTLLEEAEAERDAALAAIGRVLALHSKSDYDGGICLDCEKPWPCPTVAALDGAPEPDWEYGYRGRYTDRHPTKAGQRMERPKRTYRTPDNWLPELGEIYRRRPSLPAGPWVPVEGESKP